MRKDCSFSLRNGEEVACVCGTCVWHFPGALSVLSNVYSVIAGLVGQRCTASSLLSPCLPFPEHVGANSPLLKPRGLTQAVFGFVQLTARLCGYQAAAEPTGTPMCQCPCVLSRLLTPRHLPHGRDVAGCTGMWRAASAGSCSRFQERSVLCWLQAVLHLLIPSKVA